MLLATMLLMFALPQTADLADANNQPASVSTASANASSAAEQLPSMPAAKVKSDFAEMGAEPIGPHPGPLPLEAVKPAYIRPRETPRQRKMWYALVATSHGAAAFDAWSTQRAVNKGYPEMNPFLKPFASSGAIYAATQVSPVVMDYIGKRMMVSEHPLLRRLWWLPQLAGSGFSIGAGVHNVGVVH